MEKQLLIIATLDTKGREAAYVKDCVQRLRIHPILMDVGTLGEPLTHPDITRVEVVEAAGYRFENLIKEKNRSLAFKAVQEGGAILARHLFEKGKLHGVLGMGGGTGTAIVTHIMRSLPFGLPKVVLSTVASRDIREYIETKDIVMFHSVADILGFNEFMRLMLGQAAYAICGMIEKGSGIKKEKPMVAVTAYGINSVCAIQAEPLLQERGYEMIAFHANGIGGMAMEEFIAQGLSSKKEDFMDLRDFIKKCEGEGELKRIKAEVDWNLEMSHIAKLNEERGGPALLFEKVKGYPNQVLSSACTTTSRLALIMGMPMNTSLVELMREWVKRTTNKKPPKFVASGPCKENVLKGDQINLLKFPVPKLFPKDGGRFFGTTAYTISKDPESGWLNLGVYRLQVLDEKTLGTQFIKGKHADIMLQKYKSLKKPMPVIVAIGGDPLMFLMGAARLPAFESEYDFGGAIRGEPIEVVKGETVDLPVPANAEIVVEGEVDPEAVKPEGPLGEYTGYYSGIGSTPRSFIKVNCVTHRNNPIFWFTTVGRAVTDTHMTMALTYGATLWQELEAMRIPGIKAVYCPPEGAGRFIAIISVKQMYPGHANQVGTAAISTEMGAYGLKTVIVVDEDIDPWDLPRVLWALSFRFQPSRAQIINRGRSTPLDPSLPIDQRDITSRIIMDATIPFEWKEKPITIELDPEMVKKIKAKWSELGL